MRRVALIGTGLIGGSVGLALARSGTEVRGFDADPARALRAKELGVVSEVASSIRDAVDGVDVVVVAVPVGHVAEVVVAALDAGAPLVTDVGSVKAPVVSAVLSVGGSVSTANTAVPPRAGCWPTAAPETNPRNTIATVAVVIQRIASPPDVRAQPPVPAPSSASRNSSPARRASARYRYTK